MLTSDASSSNSALHLPSPKVQTPPALSPTPVLASFVSTVSLKTKDKASFKQSQHQQQHRLELGLPIAGSRRDSGVIMPVSAGGASPATDGASSASSSPTKELAVVIMADAPPSAAPVMITSSPTTTTTPIEGEAKKKKKKKKSKSSVASTAAAVSTSSDLPGASSPATAVDSDNDTVIESVHINSSESHLKANNIKVPNPPTVSSAGQSLSPVGLVAPFAPVLKSEAVFPIEDLEWIESAVVRGDTTPAGKAKNKKKKKTKAKVGTNASQDRPSCDSDDDEENKTQENDNQGYVGEKVPQELKSIQEQQEELHQHGQQQRQQRVHLAKEENREQEEGNVVDLAEASDQSKDPWAEDALQDWADSIDDGGNVDRNQPSATPSLVLAPATDAGTSVATAAPLTPDAADRVPPNSEIETQMHQAARTPNPCNSRLHNQPAFAHNSMSTQQHHTQHRRPGSYPHSESPNYHTMGKEPHTSKPIHPAYRPNAPGAPLHSHNPHSNHFYQHQHRQQQPHGPSPSWSYHDHPRPGPFMQSTLTFTHPNSRSTQSLWNPDQQRQSYEGPLSRKSSQGQPLGSLTERRGSVNGFDGMYQGGEYQSRSFTKQHSLGRPILDTTSLTKPHRDQYNNSNNSNSSNNNDTRTPSRHRSSFSSSSPRYPHINNESTHPPLSHQSSYGHKASWSAGPHSHHERLRWEDRSTGSSVSDLSHRRHRQSVSSQHPHSTTTGNDRTSSDNRANFGSGWNRSLLGVVDSAKEIEKTGSEQRRKKGAVTTAPPPNPKPRRVSVSIQRKLSGASSATSVAATPATVEAGMTKSTLAEARMTYDNESEIAGVQTIGGDDCSNAPPAGEGAPFETVIEKLEDKGIIAKATAVASPPVATIAYPVIQTAEVLQSSEILRSFFKDRWEMALSKTLDPRHKVSMYGSGGITEIEMFVYGA